VETVPLELPQKQPPETLDEIEGDAEGSASGAFIRVKLPAACGAGAIISGKYRVERQLATGGLGIVVVASHVELHHSVAIKYLHPHALEREELVERFRFEGQLAARIKSDHVVRVYDLGVAEACGPYMVMEHLEGEDLATTLQRGPVPMADAVDWILQACHGISAVHALGIVHRDLKPENLFLARGTNGAPVIKILDFGISKSTSRGVGEVRRHMTQDAEAFGTPMYMSPEQFRSTASVDARTDIWALGVVLFELLTGELPFDGETTAELGVKVLHDAPRALAERCPDAPEELGRILARCLEKNPEDRYASAADLARDLSALVPGAKSTSLAPPTPLVAPMAPVRSRAGWRATASAGLLLVFGATLLLGGYLFAPPAPTPAAPAPALAVAPALDIPPPPLPAPDEEPTEEVTETANVTVVATPRPISSRRARISISREASFPANVSSSLMQHMKDYAEFGERR
jgi:serine/threonine protein kinase